VQRPHKATADDMTRFHSDEYINFLKTITPESMSEQNKSMSRCEFARPGPAAVWAAAEN
jgi:histone deacetylase 1/2